MTDIIYTTDESGNIDITFEDNPDLVEYLKIMYPMMSFVVEQSLIHLHPFKNLHVMNLNLIDAGRTPREIDHIIVESLEDILINTANLMKSEGLERISAHIHRMELSHQIDHNSLNRVLKGNLRAVFVKSVPA